MPDWLIWLLAFWLLFGCGTGCRRAWSRRQVRGGAASADPAALRPGRSEPVIGSASAPGTSSHGGVDDRAAPPGRERPETRLESLQRRFVDGSITLEQYEAELDRLDRAELG